MLVGMRSKTEYAQGENRRELEQLLSGVAARSQDDLAELYRRTRTAVYGLALSYLRNAHDAQDLTQDVFVHIWDTAGQYRPTGSPVGWILAVCRNLCLMHLLCLTHPLRRRRRLRPLSPLPTTWAAL